MARLIFIEIVSSLLTKFARRQGVLLNRTLINHELEKMELIFFRACRVRELLLLFNVRASFTAGEIFQCVTFTIMILHPLNKLCDLDSEANS